MTLPLLRHLVTACAFFSMRPRTIFILPLYPSVVEDNHHGGGSSSGVIRRMCIIMLLIGGLVLVLLLLLWMPRAKATEVGSCGEGNGIGALWLLDRTFLGISKVLRVGASDMLRL